jgi:6-phosphofructokinase 2
MESIVTFTINPAVDVFLEVPRLVPGHKLRCLAPLYEPGGGGVNVSRAIRRLGGTSVALFPAGGSPGDQLVTMLEREDIPVNVVRVAQPTREDVNVVERATGSEYRFIVPGPELSYEEWHHCLRALRSIQPVPDIVVASGSLPPAVPIDFYRRVAEIATEAGFRLIVDTSGEPLRYAATAGTFLLKPNVGELASIAGGAISESIVEGAARAIVSTGRSQIVVISMGGGGAMLADARGVKQIAAPIVPIASRVGAGDSMVAGIAISLARGWDIDDAVQFGVAAGSAAVMAPGHRLCSREQTELLFEQMRLKHETIHPLAGV